MSIRIFLATFLISLTATLTVQAEVIDEGETIFDEDTEFRWVKPTTTIGVSTAEANAEQNSTGQYAFCRWPSRDEVEELIANMGIPDMGSPDPEVLEDVILLLGDTLDARLDAINDPLDVSPDGAGWTKANLGEYGGYFLNLRDGERVDRITGAPVSDSADFVLFESRPEWDGDGDTGVLLICPTWPTKPIASELIDFETQPEGSGPVIEGDYRFEGDASILTTPAGNKVAGSEVCNGCAIDDFWTTSITLSRLDGLPFAFLDMDVLANLGNCDDNLNYSYPDRQWENPCTYRGVTTWGETVYFRYSPNTAYNEWPAGEGPWLNLQSLTIQATCGTGDGFGNVCIGGWSSQITIDNVEVAESTYVELDFNPWSGADIIDPTVNALITLEVATTSLADGDLVDFDAADIDPDTLRLGIANAVVKAAPISHDRDGDGDTDIVFGFRTQDTGIRCIDKSMILSGQTFAGLPFSGSVDVNMSPNCFQVIDVEFEPFDPQSRVYPDDDYQVLVKLNELELLSDGIEFNPEAVNDGIRLGPNSARPHGPPLKAGSSNTDFEPYYIFEMQETGIACDDTEVEVVGLYLTSVWNGSGYDSEPAFPSGAPAFKGTASIQTLDCETATCHP